MIKLLYLNPRMIIAGEGKTLTDGTVYQPVVYLGKEESPENWTEIDLADVPESEVG